MKLEPLTNGNWKLLAAKHYDNVQCFDDEFEQDLKRLKYIKKAITRYKVHGELCDRLILNHMMILNNVFGPTFLCRLLFLKMEEHLPCLKPFLVFMSILPSIVPAVGDDGKDYRSDAIPLDQGVVTALRSLSRVL